MTSTVEHFIAGMDWANKQGITTADGRTMLIESISKAFVDASLDVLSSLTIVQRQSVNCQTPTDWSQGTRAFSDNLGCQKCHEARAAFTKARNYLEAQAYAKSGGSYTPQKPSAAVLDQWIDPFGDDVCKFVCFNCVLADAEQQVRATLSQSVDWSLTTSDFYSAFNQKLNEQVGESVQDANDAILKNTKTSSKNLCEFLGISKDADCLANMKLEVVQRIQQKLTSTIRTEVVTRVLAYQNIEISPESRSVWVENVSQSFTVDVVQQVVNEATQNVAFYDENKVQLYLQQIERQEAQDLEEMFGKIASLTHEALIDLGISALVLVVMSVLILLLGYLTLRQLGAI